MEISVCKGCKDLLKSNFLYGRKKFQESPYIPYIFDFLRVNSHGYGYDLGGFFGISAQYPPRILNNRGCTSQNGK